MTFRLLQILLLVTTSLSGFAKNFETIEAAFQSFILTKKTINIEGLQKNVAEKNSFLELKNKNTTLQFGRYEGTEEKEIFVFNYFVDTSYNQPAISIGCYEYINNTWKEVTDVVLPMLSFNDFYGTATAPPKSFANTVQFRFILHKNNTLHIVIEPHIKGENEKFDRIFDQRRYAAVQTKWNKNTAKFEIAKWLK